ncbi:PREDICTED: tripartite motif-containing protein 43-like [Elephantulus edwardii]|uniref:tripartite motif-containing protein 43-like n=1 Tax=Elephantulus edwardii TaxID=28737 RepID=UPI0003F0B3A2|nr:PREDICTED: tripartite motif-containing protein 43-like [Elephantulus edwardii]
MDITEDFQKEITCSICLGYIKDLVVIGCGHTFSRPCIDFTCKKGIICPVYREVLKVTDITPSVLVEELVSLARQSSLGKFLSAEEHLCETHKKPKKISCEKRKSLLCLLCSKTQKHEADRHFSIQSTVKEYREKLTREMTSLRRKIKENERDLSEESKKKERWMYYIHVYAMMIHREYKKLHPVLQENGTQQLILLSHHRSIIEKQFQKTERALLKKHKELHKMYEELLNMCDKPDVELLQELGGLLFRSKSVQLRMPEPVNPAYRAIAIPGLMSRVGVYVDFDCSSVSFVNVAKSSLIWRYPDNSFNWLEAAAGRELTPTRIHWRLTPGGQARHPGGEQPQSSENRVPPPPPTPPPLGMASRGLQPVLDEEVIDLYGDTQHIPLYHMSGFYGKGP